MTDIVLSVAAKVAEYLVAPVGRQCGYVIFTNSYVGQLKEELKKLDEVSFGVQRSVIDAENNMREIRLEVNRWKNVAESSADKARGVLGNDGRANETCFCGWLPNPKERYCLGRDARKTAQAIQKLIQDGRFETVCYERAPPGYVPGASDVNLSADDGGDTITDSRASIFQDIMKALDDEKQKVIGVYGPGGVGKTTLLEEVEKKLKKEGRPFHMIVKAKVSQTPDLNKIQDDIAYFFGLKLKDEPSEEGRRDLLCQRLQKDPSEKILIILDDLWDKLDLRAVGIPLGDESRGYKLLLTSRFKDVLEKEMGANQTFLLQGLKHDEAFRLFESTVGDQLKDNEELKSIADQVVNKLAGLPLLIISVASTLKSSDECAWRNALIEIDESNKEKTETIVKLSYGHLKSEDAKYLFLLCGLIGGTIQVELLFVLAMGLGFFERFNKTIQDSRDRLNNTLNELRSACLLLDGGDGKDNVTIHDLYSEVVVSTPFRDQNSLMINNNYGSLSKEKLEKYWAICLDDVGTDRLAELMPGQFPSLKILMLSTQKVWHWKQEHQHDEGDCSGLLDFTDMKELQVLYLRSMYRTNLPPSIEILGNLHSLYLDNCNVKDLAIIGKLKALQILSFVGSTISRLPKEMGELTNLRLLNLNYCRELQRIELGVLKRLIQLEELHMKGSFNRWMGKNAKPSELCNVGLAELRSMTKLNSLEISICDPIILLEDYDLPFENLTRFHINIGNVVGREFKGLRTMKIKLEGHDSILSNTWVQKTLQKTQYLYLDGLGEFENAYGLCIRGFPQLKHLDIQNSPSIKYVVSLSNSAFAILESLFLSNLINLEKISHDYIVAECFNKLKDVRVKKCNRLEYLWSLSHVHNLVQVEKINVQKCNSMRAIARKDIVLADYKVELPYLRHLSLANLLNMRSFCSRAEMTSEGTPKAGVVDEGGGDEGTELVTTTSYLQNTYSDSFFDKKASLPNLEMLKLYSLGSFKRIWHNELSETSFCKLAIIIVDNCSNLLHIFPSTIIWRLHNLKGVGVKNCPSLKSLFDFGSLDSNMEQNAILLPELERINIESCPSLESLFNCGSLDTNAEQKIILLPKLEKVSVSGAKKLRHVVMSHSQIVLGFPSLETVSVKNCFDLRYLFPKDTATTLEKLKWLEITKCEQMKEVILEKEPSQSEAKVMSFPCLSELTLEELNNLISFSSRSLKRQLGETDEENDESPQPLFNEMVTFPNMRNLKIEGVPCKELWNNHVHADSSVCSHRFLSNFKVKNCPSLKSLFDFGSLDSNTEQNAILLPELEMIDVESCPSLESLFNYGSLDSNVECKIILLPKLEKVSVSGAKKLRHVVMSHSQIVLGFPNLETISVKNCSNLRYLFPKYTATTLEKLKWLHITKCEQMKEVILEEEVIQSKVEVMSFPCLRELILKELDNFGVFISSPTSVKRQLFEIAEENDELPHPLFNEMVTFPNITRLEIMSLHCKELWNDQIPTDSFKKLEYLLLNNCDNLQCIATSYMWKKLQHCLKELNVTSCHLIKIIYEGDGTDIESGNLTRLVLRNLENLRCIWQSDSLPNILFPNLRDVEVVRCPCLETLFPTFTAKFLQQIEELVVESCENMELIADHEKWEEATGTTIAFSKLTGLRLFELPKFKSFLPEKYSLKFLCSEDFPSLQVLSIESCGAELDQVLGNWRSHTKKREQDRASIRLNRIIRNKVQEIWLSWSSFLLHSPSP